MYTQSTYLTFILYSISHIQVPVYVKRYFYCIFIAKRKMYAHCLPGTGNNLRGFARKGVKKKTMNLGQCVTFVIAF